MKIPIWKQLFLHFAYAIYFGPVTELREGR